MAALRRLLEADVDGIRPKEDAGALEPEELKVLGLSGREMREFVDKLQPVNIPDYELDISVMRRAEDVAAELEEAVPGLFE